MTESEIAFSVETLLAVHRHEHQRLHTGSLLRSLVHKQLAQGLEPSSYRLEWLRTNIDRVISLLHAASQEFNATYLNDRCSVGDLLDVLASAKRTIENRSGWVEK